MTGARLISGPDGRARCWWPGADPGYLAYHDREWGRPVTDDARLFEKLCLEGFQAGLSWLTILRKRENFRAAFAYFDIAAVAAFGPGDVERLMGDAGIVRHRGKIASAVNNARRAAELIAEFGSLAAYLWSWAPAAEPGAGAAESTAKAAAGNTAAGNTAAGSTAAEAAADGSTAAEAAADGSTAAEAAAGAAAGWSMPSVTAASTALARDLKRRGWTFVGPTTVYAFMQSVGMVNDHVPGCFARSECRAERTGIALP